MPAKFSLPKAIREREKPAEIREGLHPLIRKRLLEREEQNGPDKRRKFLAARYSVDSGSGQPGSATTEQSDIQHSVSGDSEQVLQRVADNEGRPLEGEGNDLFEGDGATDGSNDTE